MTQNVLTPQVWHLNAQTIGWLSGGLVFLSSIPYAIRTYQRKVRPVSTSWSLWSLLGLALLLTYRSAGADANVWPAVFGFINPTLITIVTLLRQGRWRSPTALERLCFAFGIVSLTMWFFFRQSGHFAQYALYLAILADLCAAIPTILFVWKQPGEDRPLAWVLFAVGYFIAVFAIPSNTVANWILPLYMSAVALLIAFPLAWFRLRRRVPLSQWA